MRGHKFVCMVDPTYFLEHEFDDINVVDQIVWTDDAFMQVLTFPFPEMSDNLVTLRTEGGDEYEFARTINGRLYYLSDWMDKTTLINMFEQTDEGIT